MSSYSSGKKNDLNDALTALMLPIGTLLISNRVGVGELVYAAKHAYVKAAIESVLTAGSRVNTSRLSVVTGLTRKEVSSLLEEMRGRKSPKNRYTNEQRALRVLRGWRVDGRFSKRSGKMADLPLRGNKRSFSQLVKLYAGDVTPVSVLKELQRMKAVSIRTTGRVSMNASWTKERSLRQLIDVARHLPYFIRALDSSGRPSGEASFFAAKSSLLSSSIQAARFQHVFTKRADALLNGVDQWFASQESQHRGLHGNKKCRVGVGVYLIHDPAVEAVKCES